MLPLCAFKLSTSNQLYSYAVLGFVPNCPVRYHICYNVTFVGKCRHVDVSVIGLFTTLNF